MNNITEFAEGDGTGLYVLKCNELYFKARVNFAICKEK